MEHPTNFLIIKAVTFHEITHYGLWELYVVRMGLVGWVDECMGHTPQTVTSTGAQA